ncbi:MAG: cytochrome P460 family protein [Trichlorobacter sp.]|jgi:mono/diheme cytochrome c family protein
MIKTVLTLSCLIISLAGPTQAASQSPLPKGYSGWKKSVRKVVTDKKSLFYGIHYIYADPKAMQGYRAGNRFPEGSRIIVEHFTIKADNPAVDGSKNMVVLMQKDKRQQATGGWLYAGYTAQGRSSGLDTVQNCFSCHQKEVASRDYVFSGIQDFK